jgi:toxin ParE1/3/4
LKRSASRIELLPGIKEDIERIVEHLIAHHVEDIPGRIDEILNGFDVLAAHPKIGRPVGEGAQRELILGRGSKGYVALYEYVEEPGMIFIVAIRSQREVGYAR